MLSPDDIAALVHQQYARLPKTGKPQAGEWTVLAGIVLVSPLSSPHVIALGTGTKCLTASQIGADAHGECLHDSHAEVCARRALLAVFLAYLFVHVIKGCHHAVWGEVFSTILCLFIPGSGSEA